MLIAVNYPPLSEGLLLKPSQRSNDYGIQECTGGGAFGEHALP